MVENIESKKQELIRALRRLYNQSGGKRPRTIDAQNDVSGPCYGTYIKYFGSWENALREGKVDKKR